MIDQNQIGKMKIKVKYYRKLKIIYNLDRIYKALKILK